MMRRASESLRHGSVLVDANFASAALREQASECARSAGAQIAFVWFQAGDREVELRMEQRRADEQCVSDADIEIYRKLKVTFEPPAAVEGVKLIIAQPGGDRDQRVAAILCQLM
jgi:predicted kinase